MAYINDLSSISPDFGKGLRDQYREAHPFPHIVIDDFLAEPVLQNILDQFPAKGGVSNDRQQERLKRSIDPNTCSALIRSIFLDFNAKPFITWLENLTGITGLIPDPYFVGGGLHEIKEGGSLGMHADFNYHPKLRCERRINVLIYLNHGWTENHGGELELWEGKKEMEKCAKKVIPVFNRCVVFNTTMQSWHGNPRPVAPGKVRRSIALYYYTATWTDDKKAYSATVFKQRPGSNDTYDFKLAAHRTAREWLPPAVFRQIAKKLNG